MTDRRTFDIRLDRIVVDELSRAINDPDSLADMVEGLMRAAAMVIAFGARGDPAGMSVLLTGCDAYLNEQAADFAKTAANFREIRRG